MEKKLMDKLLAGFDWDVRCIDSKRDPYSCGAADADMRAISAAAELFGDSIEKTPYKFEAYKRVMQFESVEQYKRDYPKPISKLQKA
jgi:hypothetical protein